jgi:type II secretory pathway component GspD/PulD (secretin)
MTLSKAKKGVPMCAAPPAAAAPCPKTVASCAASPCHREPQKTREDDLIKLITSTIAPQSWVSNGGRGTIEYFPLESALVISQTPDIHEQIEEMLQSLRRLQDQEIAVEVRLISISESDFERIGVDFEINTGSDQPKHEPRTRSEQFWPYGFINQFIAGEFIAGLTPASSNPPETPGCDQPKPESKVEKKEFHPFGLINHLPDAYFQVPIWDHMPMAGSRPVTQGVKFLNDFQVAEFMNILQQDPRCSVMAAPKITMLNGQASQMNVTEQHTFVTGVNTTQVGGQIVMVPKQESFETGLHLAVQPVVSADRRFIRLCLKASETTLATPVPLYPVTTMVTPVFEGGAVGQPVPFTQYIQQPALNTQCVEKTVTVPIGGSVLLNGWKKTNRARYEYGTPVLSKIPYVNRLFKNVGYRTETECVMLLVTPRLLGRQEEECPPATERIPAPEYMAPEEAAPPMHAESVAKAVAVEIKKWEQAQAKYHKAEHYRQAGKTEQAGKAYAEVQQLCPASRYAKLAARRMEQMHDQVASRDHAGDTEEQEAPPSAPVQDQSEKVEKLMEKYFLACEKGQSTLAKKWAGQALALDPACFYKEYRSQLNRSQLKLKGVPVPEH